MVSEVESRQMRFRRRFQEGKARMAPYISRPGSEGEPRPLRRRMARDWARNQMRLLKEKLVVGAGT